MVAVITIRPGAERPGRNAPEAAVVIQKTCSRQGIPANSARALVIAQVRSGQVEIARVLHAEFAWPRNRTQRRPSAASLLRISSTCASDRLASRGLAPQFRIAAGTEENVNRVAGELQRPGQPLPPGLDRLPEERLMLRVARQPDHDQGLARRRNRLSRS